MNAGYERRLLALEQFADALRCEAIEDNAFLAKYRVSLSERLRIQAVEMLILRLMVESLIENHPDACAVKTAFQSRLSTEHTNIFDGCFEADLPVEKVRDLKDVIAETSDKWIRRLFQAP